MSSIFNREKRPHNTVEEWGVIGGNGLYAHGVPPNPFVSPASYVCHTNCETKDGMKKMRESIHSWTMRQASQDDSILMRAKVSVEELLADLSNGVMPSDMMESTPMPGAIGSIKSFNITSTEHTLPSVEELAMRMKSKRKKRSSSLPPSTRASKGSTIPNSRVRDLFVLDSSGKAIEYEINPAPPHTPPPLPTDGKTEEQEFVPFQLMTPPPHPPPPLTLSGSEDSLLYPADTESSESDDAEHDSNHDSDLTDEHYFPEPEPEYLADVSEDEQKQTSSDDLDMENEIAQSLKQYSVPSKDWLRAQHERRKRLDKAVARAKEAARKLERATNNTVKIKNKPRRLNRSRRRSKTRRESNASMTSSTATVGSTSSRRASKEVALEMEIERLNRELQLLRDDSSIATTADDFSDYIYESKVAEDDSDIVRANMNKTNSKKLPGTRRRSRNAVVNAVREIMAELDAESFA